MNKNMRAGYQGKKDAMRDMADKLLNHPGKAKDIYFSKSCADKEPMRPFKEGGMVNRRDDGEKRTHEDKMDNAYKHGGKVEKCVKRQKFAEGGIGKLRHDQMTADGKQKGTKRESLTKTVYY